MDKLTGDTFSPLNRSGMSGGSRAVSGGASADRSTPIQQAIRVLSLRVPKVAGASAPVAQSLMSAPGGAALGGMNLGAMGSAGGGPQAAYTASASPVSGGPMQTAPAPSLGLEEILRRLFGLGAAVPGMVSPAGVPPPAQGPGGWRTVNESALAGGQPPASAPPPRITIGTQPGAPVAVGPEVTTPEPPQVPDNGYAWQQPDFSPWNQSGSWDRSF